MKLEQDEQNKVCHNSGEGDFRGEDSDSNTIKVVTR